MNILESNFVGELEVAVEFLSVSIILLRGAREHRDIVSVLPTCLNKEIMGWGSLTGRI